MTRSPGSAPNAAPTPTEEPPFPLTDPDLPLLVAPCTNPAARWAVRRWHYTRRPPVHGKLATFGVWEYGAFLGAIIYGRGATQHLGRPYGLGQDQCIELVRVALREHQAPVTRMIAASLRQLRAACPGLRLVVSFADTDAGHHGGIYQAGNWIYTGTTAPNPLYAVRGRIVHGRTLRHLAVKRPPGETAEAFVRRTIDPQVRKVTTTGVKHRYLYPLDRAMRRQITPLAKPYPRRESR